MSGHDVQHPEEDPSDIPDREDLGHFVQQLTACQADLRAYILAALGNHANTEDVLQRTNLTLWKKANDFQRGTNFVAWAVAVARFEVLRFYRDTRRDRHVFDQDVAELMLSTAESGLRESSGRQDALRECLKRLPANHRSVLWKRYDEGLSIKQIAAESDRSIDAVKSLLLRIRRSLESCVQSKIRTEPT